MSRQLHRSIMGCGLLFLFLLIGQKGWAQTIRLDLHGTDLSKVVAALQQQVPNVNFTYSQEVLEKVKVDRIQVKAGKLEEALQLLQSQYGLHYLLDGSNVTLKYVAKNAQPDAPMAGARKIDGIVLDENGQPVRAASVIVKGTQNAVMTDDNGHYSILALAGEHLQVSSIGFTTQDVLVKGASPLDIRMRQGRDALNELVFVGYQKMRKSDFSGAVASVKASELNVSAPSAGQALVGKVAGVVVSQTDGSPYATPKIRVRGVGSFNASTDPLYVIDGYPSSPDLYINPNDIESIDILKDAASSAIYGSRASGGVVLITTKRGKAGKGKLEYDYMYGVNQPAHKVKLLNSDQFAQLVIDGRNDSYRDLVENQGLVWNDNMLLDNNATRVARVGNGSSISIPTELYDFTTGKEIKQKYNTDWQKELYRNAPFLRHNLSFSGGTEKVRYMLSGDYQNQDGIMVNTSQVKVNFRGNIDAELTDKIKVGANISYTGNTNHETQEGRWDHSPAFGALIYMPTFPAYNPDGSIAQYLAASESAQYGYQSIENPIATAELTQIKRQGNRATYNAFLTYEFIPHLVLKTNLGTQTYSEKYDYYLPTSLSNGTNPPFSAASIAAANAVAQSVNQKDQLAEFTLTYDRHFGPHAINILGGYTVQSTSSDVLGITAKGFQNDLVPEVTAGTPGQITILSGSGKGTFTLQSYLARAQYNYEGKYYLTGSFRTDGSSRFGTSNKWVAFPSVSAGWTISKENFYKGWLEEHTTLRLRASWGLSGNNNIGNYNTVTTFTSPSGVIFGNNVISQAYHVDSVKDRNLRWESTQQYNFGLDLGLFHDRVQVIANYYDSRSYNLLVYNNISAVSGASLILTNLRNSRIKNSGFDIQVDGKVIQSRGGFNLNVNGNISINRNKVLNLGGASTIISVGGAERQYITHITQTGQPIGMFYGYKVAGMVRAKDTAGIAADTKVYNANGQTFPKGYKLQGPARSLAQTNALRPGDLYFKDVNGDGVVNASDLSVIGTPYPKFTYGFSLAASYKAVDVSASFAGSYGNQILDGQDYYLFNMEGSGNQYVDVAQRYRSESEPGNGHVYRASRAGTQSNSTRLSTFYLQDGSFLRCTNITIGFNLPDVSMLHKAGISAIRIYGGINNAFTITKYKGYNPEVDYNYSVGSATANLTPGVDYGVYPLVRSFNLGAHVTF